MYLGAERRGKPRDRVTSEGIIWHDDPYSMIICTVRDVSPAGAGLVLPDSVSRLPREFDLTFDRVTHQCVVVWRQFNRIGARYK
jgi:hypothetical protein